MTLSVCCVLNAAKRLVTPPENGIFQDSAAQLLNSLPVQTGNRTDFNRPFPSFRKTHFQNEAKCKTFVVKMSFICIIIKNHFHINGFALSLTFKVRFLELGNGLLLLSVETLSYSGINPHSVAILHEQTVTVASYE